MLVTLKEVLKVAEEKEIAIGAFNAPNLESLQAVMAAAEEMDLPVIIQFAPVHEVHNPLALMGPLMVDFAKKAKVPVCVHLDHGDSIDRVKFALSMGFTSVMYDGPLFLMRRMWQIPNWQQSWHMHRALISRLSLEAWAKPSPAKV